MNYDKYEDSYQGPRRLEATNTESFLGLRFINSQDDLVSERNISSKPNFIIQGDDVLIDYSGSENNLDLEEIESIFRKKRNNQQFTITNADYSNSIKGVDADFNGTYTFKRLIDDDRILATPISGVSFPSETRIYRSDYFKTTPLIGVTLPPDTTLVNKIVNELGIESRESFANLGALVGDSLKISGASGSVPENRLLKITDIEFEEDGTEIITVNRKVDEHNFTGVPVIVTLYKNKNAEPKKAGCFYAKETIFDVNSQQYIESGSFVSCSQGYDFYNQIIADRKDYDYLSFVGDCEECPEFFTQGTNPIEPESISEPETPPVNILSTSEYRDYTQLLTEVRPPRSTQQITEEYFTVKYENDQFTINGETNLNVEMAAGKYYYFDLSDSSLSGISARPWTTNPLHDCANETSNITACLACVDAKVSDGDIDVGCANAIAKGRCWEEHAKDPNQPLSQNPYCPEILESCELVGDNTPESVCFNNTIKTESSKFAISKVRGGTNIGGAEFSSGVSRSGSLGEGSSYVAFRPPIDYRDYYWYIEGTDFGGKITVKKTSKRISITKPVIRETDYSNLVFETYDMFSNQEKANKRSTTLGCSGVRVQRINDQEYYLPCDSDADYEYYLGLYNVKERKVTGPFSINGYYPLYNTPQAAVSASPTPTESRNEEERQLGFIGYHTHILDGVTYFMPNGLDLLGQQFHGNYVDDETYARSIPYDPEYITVSPEDIANGNYPPLRDPPDFPGGVNTCCTCDQRGCQTNCMECLFKAIQAVESGDWRNPFDDQQPLKQCDARASATAGGCGPFQIFPAYVEDARSVCRYGGGQSEPHCCDIPANAHELLCQNCGDLPLPFRLECCQFKLKLSRLIVYCWYRRWTRNQKFRNCGLPDCTGSGHKSRQDGHTCYTCEDMAKMHKEGTCGHRCCQKPECCYQAPNEAEGGGPCARANQYWARVQSLMQTECPECLGPVISPTGTPSQKGCCCVSNTTIDNLTKTDCDRLGGLHNPGAECETGPCDGCCCQVEYLPDGSIISYGETTRPEDCDDTPNNGKTFFPGQSCDDPRNPCGSEYGPDEPLLCCAPAENEFGDITSYTCITSTIGQNCPAGTTNRTLLAKCEEFDTPCAVGCCCFPEPGGFQKRYISRISCQHQGGLFSPGISCKDTNCLFNDNPDVEEQVFVNKYTKVTDINEVVVDPGYSITEQTQTAITYVQQTPEPTPAPQPPAPPTVAPPTVAPPTVAPPTSPPPMGGSMGGYSY